MDKFRLIPCPGYFKLCFKYNLPYHSLQTTYDLAFACFPSFFFKKMYLFIFAVLDVCCWLWASSSYGEQGLPSSCGGRASHCRGFPWCGACALGPWAQLSLGMWDLPDPGISSLFPALSGILYHWATREGPPAPKVFWITIFLALCSSISGLIVFFSVLG